jgi:hypothetical protein
MDEIRDQGELVIRCPEADACVFSCLVLVQYCTMQKYSQCNKNFTRTTAMGVSASTIQVGTVAAHGLSIMPSVLSTYHCQNNDKFSLEQFLLFDTTVAF